MWGNIYKMLNKANNKNCRVKSYFKGYLRYRKLVGASNLFLRLTIQTWKSSQREISCIASVVHSVLTKMYKRQLLASPKKQLILTLYLEDPQYQSQQLPFIWHLRYCKSRDIPNSSMLSKKFS